jgi:hypothetical protein
VGSAHPTGYLTMVSSDNNQQQTIYNEHRIFEGIYQIFEAEFIEIGRYIAFSENNLKTYSNKIHELHLRVCSEIENILKVIVHKYFVTQKQVNSEWENKKSVFLNEKGKTEDYEKLKLDLNSKDKKELDKYLFGFPDFCFYYDIACNSFNLNKKVVSFQISVSPDPQYDVIQPFDKSQGISVPSWWTSYNKIKHNKISSYASCTLGDLINSMAGLYILMNYLMKYWPNNLPTFDPSYFRNYPNRNYIGHEFWSFSSKIFQSSSTYQSISLLRYLPYELSMLEYDTLLEKIGQRLDEIVDTVVGDNPFLLKMATKENCIFHTYFDYTEYFDTNINGCFKRLERYGKFVN